MIPLSRCANFQLPTAEGHSRSQFLTGVIIFSLKYFGCEIESISSVLSVYKLASTSDQIAEYIENYELIEHVDESHPKDGGLRHTRGIGECFTIVTIEFAQGLPMKMRTESPRLPALILREAVTIQAAGGRKVRITVTCRQVSCRIVN